MRRRSLPPPLRTARVHIGAAAVGAALVLLACRTPAPTSTHGEGAPRTAKAPPVPPAPSPLPREPASVHVPPLVRSADGCGMLITPGAAQLLSDPAASAAALRAEGCHRLAY